MNQRRRCLLLAVGTALAPLASGADEWPTHPLKVVVPIAAGSVSDIVPRLVCEQLGKQLGQTIVVENRPGAGMTIGTSQVARAAPDGYTALATSSAHAIAPALYPSLTYQPSKDFVAVAALGTAPFVLVVSSARGFRTARDLVTAAKAKPGTFNFSSPGVGTASHLSAERFLASAGIQATHVPYRGGAEALTEVIAGRIDFFFVAVGAGLPFIADGKLSALAVNGSTRSAVLPDVPTLHEAGFDDAEYPSWFGLFLPAKTPPLIVDRLRLETLRALNTREVKDRLQALGVDPLPLTAAQLDALVESDIVVNAALVKAIGLKPQ